MRSNAKGSIEATMRSTSEAAKLPHRIDGRVIDDRDAVPQEVAPRRLHQQGALSDSNCRLGPDSGQAQIIVDLVLMTGPELFERGPSLPRPSHVLPLVLADYAVVGRFIARFVLDTAGGADVSVHHTQRTATGCRAPRPGGCSRESRRGRGPAKSACGCFSNGATRTSGARTCP